MKLQRQDGEWPASIAPPGATVIKATVDGASGYLHLELRHSSRRWKSVLTIPAPWTFASCLLSFSSEQLEPSEEDPRPAVELIGLEGAALSRIDRDIDRIDLVFDSIRISVTER